MWDIYTTVLTVLLSVVLTVWFIPVIVLLLEFCVAFVKRNETPEFRYARKAFSGYRDLSSKVVKEEPAEWGPHISDIFYLSMGTLFLHCILSTVWFVWPFYLILCSIRLFFDVVEALRRKSGD